MSTPGALEPRPCRRASSTDLGLTELRRVLPQRALRVTGVSAWSVGMHVHHCCLSMLAIVDSLSSSAPPAPRTLRSLVGRFVLWRGRLPRGRARAPEFVLPSEVGAEEGLEAFLEEAARGLARASTLHPQSWIRHFALGTLTRDRALQFAGVHNEHHLRIIADIVAAAGASAPDTGSGMAAGRPRR